MLGSLLAGCGVAGLMLLAGARLHGALSTGGEVDALRAVPVDRLPDGGWSADTPARPGQRVPPALPPAAPITGHVEFDVRVDATGRVIDAQIIGASVPEPLRELARQRVLDRTYPARPARFAETVDFRPPPEPALD